MPHEYEPIPVSVEMSQYGYWIVTVSVTPGQQVSVMLNPLHVTREEALSWGETAVKALRIKGKAG